MDGMHAIGAYCFRSSRQLSSSPRVKLAWLDPTMVFDICAVAEVLAHERRKSSMFAQDFPILTSD